MKKASPLTEQQWVQQQIATLATVLAAERGYPSEVAVETAAKIWRQADEAAVRYLAERADQSTEAY